MNYDLISILLTFPRPVLYAPIEFLDNDDVIMYTDCFEISLLRFLHLVFGVDGQINMNQLYKYMDDSIHSKSLYDFFDRNNSYANEPEFYISGEGMELRTKWAVFLNNSKLFKYKKDNKYEVCASIENLLLFFDKYFPKMNVSNDSPKLTLQNIEEYVLVDYYHEKIKIIMELLSFNYELDSQINMSYRLSKEDKIYIDTVMHIYINGFNFFDWQIYQFYEIKENKIGERITGHSDYKISNKIFIEEDVKCSFIDSV